MNARMVEVMARMVGNGCGDGADRARGHVVEDGDSFDSAVCGRMIFLRGASGSGSEWSSDHDLAQ